MLTNLLLVYGPCPLLSAASARAAPSADRQSLSGMPLEDNAACARVNPVGQDQKIWRNISIPSLSRGRARTVRVEAGECASHPAPTLKDSGQRTIRLGCFFFFFLPPVSCCVFVVVFF